MSVFVQDANKICKRMKFDCILMQIDSSAIFSYQLLIFLDQRLPLKK